MTRSSDVRLRPFWWAAAAAVLLCLVFAVLLDDSFSPAFRREVTGIGLLVAGLLTATSAGFRAAASAGRRRRAWSLLAAAAVVAVLGNLWVAVSGADPVENPSELSNLSISVALLMSIAGLWSLPARTHHGAEKVRMVLDGLVVGFAVMVITALIVYPPVLETATERLDFNAFAALLIPMLDVLLATVAVLLMVRSVKSDRVPLFLVAAGFLTYVPADLAFAVLSAQERFAFGTRLDLGWIAGYLLIALAASYPTSKEDLRLAERTPGADVQGTVLVFAVLLVAAAVQIWTGEGGSLNVTVAVLWLLLLVAAGTRQLLLTIDNAHLRRGLEKRVAAQTADIRRLAKQTELLLSSVADGIYGVDQQGRITFLNPSGANALGYSPEELHGRNAHDVFHAPGPDGVPFPYDECYIAEAIEHGVTAHAEEDQYARADGAILPVEITASPLVDDERGAGAVVVFRDVTQRREVDRMKNEFLSVVSHELRTPLTSIRGSLGLLSAGALGQLDPRAHRLATVALESSERLTRLINDILDMERIESGMLPMEMREHDAADLVRTAVSGVAALGAAVDVRIETGTLSGRVVADADRIVQTLTNLIGNSVKFSTPGSAVLIEAAPVENGRSVRFAVHDTGRGIPEDKLASVFDRFEQVDSSDARQKGGTGLGLAISKGIVAGHGGTIWAESELGVGTTMLFTIPAALPRDPAGGPALVSTAEAELVDEPAADVDGAPLVLVCDDDEAVAETVAAMLRSHGYRTVAVTDGSVAVARARQDRPSAVVLDLVMPGTSGAEVLEELEGDPLTSGIPIVVLSGINPAGEPGVASQVDGWLVKPVSSERLAGAVAVALHGHRTPTQVLVIEDDPNVAQVLLELLDREDLEVGHASTVAAALELGRRLKPRVVVLDLQLPDGSGADVVARLRREGHLHHTAVIVYCAVDDSEARSANDLEDAVVLTKGRTAPVELRDRVMHLVDAVTGRETHER